MFRTIVLSSAVLAAAAALGNGAAAQGGGATAMQPGERMRMPVIFYVDPKMLADPDAANIERITLSYTFYPVDPANPAS